MMGAVREWLTSIVVVTLLLSVAQTLIPEGSIRKIAGFTGGLILLVTLLRPVLGADLTELRLDFGDYTEKVQTIQAELEADRAEDLAERIAGQTAAYISDKAAALGLAVTARVDTKPGPEGVPVPAAVELVGPRSQALADWMEQELDIPAERQVWHGREGKD